MSSLIITCDTFITYRNRNDTVRQFDCNLMHLFVFIINIKFFFIQKLDCGQAEMG